MESQKEQYRGDFFSHITLFGFLFFPSSSSIQQFSHKIPNLNSLFFQDERTKV
jgi:hypothetical protein